MCRGCIILKGGKSTTDEYLKWLDEYHEIIWRMKSLEKKIHAYVKNIDSNKHRKMVDGLHKAAIKTRKKYASLDSAYLNDA